MVMLSLKYPNKSPGGDSTVSSSRRVKLIMERFESRNPNPRCELFHLTSYQLLVSVVLSAQTTDKAVNGCMKKLYEKGLTPEDVVAMGEEGFLPEIKSLGLAPTKARHVVALSRILIERYGGGVPRHMDELIALPGVGRKTANVILAELYGEPTLAVDTHVFRVGKRLALHNELRPERAEKVLLDILPQRFLPRAHHWLILHGRYVCRARSPRCGECFLADVCSFPRS